MITIIDGCVVLNEISNILPWPFLPTPKKRFPILDGLGKTNDVWKIINVCMKEGF